MTHELRMGSDHILHLAFIGDVDNAAIDSFVADYEPYLAQLTAGEKLHMLIDAARDGKFSAKARRTIADLGNDPLLGRTAIINGKRITRVMVSFMTKVTRSQGMIQFFDSEAEAVAWLKAGK